MYGPVCATKADAEIELDKLLAARAERKLLKRSSATVAQYVGNHLDNDAHVGARTLERYRSILRCQIAPHIGGVKLQDLKASHLTKLYADLETTRSDNKKKVGLSKATIRQVHALMHVVLAFAEQDDILATNVAAKVKQKPKAQSPEVRPPADNDLGRLLDALRGSDLYTLVLLAAHTGMRRGELLGLRWADVNLGEQVLTVARSLYELGDGTLDFKSPKNGVTRRVLLDAHACAALEAHRREQANTIGISKLVFPSPRDRVQTKDGKMEIIRAGSRWQPSVVSGLFKRAASRAAVPMHFHALRHYTASLMLANGAPMKVISDRLGHSSMAITERIYAHLGNDQRRAGAEMASLKRRSS